MVVTTKFNGKPVKITLKDTLYALQIAFTVISIGRCDNASYHAEFAHNKSIIKNSEGRIILQAPKLHDLYRTYMNQHMSMHILAYLLMIFTKGLDTSVRKLSSICSSME